MAAPAEKAAQDATAKAPAKVIENPALRMLGLPRLRAKLPSRNWLIFWSVLAGFSGSVYYDRRQKRIIQQKWCNAVSHLSAEPLATNALPRKITVYLAAPPGDSLRPMREQFQEYVKPILVSAGVDWETIEGRREGDVRATLAEQIRKRRRKEMNQPIEDDEDIVEELRASLGVQTPDSRGGDLVLGRHTWKEYIRGLHEGWLGPIQPPEDTESLKDVIPRPDVSSPVEAIPVDAPQQTLADSGVSAEEPQQTSEAETKAEEKKEEEKPPKKPSPPRSYIFPQEYASSTASNLPSELPASVAIENPHLLGFLKTPIRIARFLNRRRLAEDQGRQIVDLLLTNDPITYARSDDWEQTTYLDTEEQMWHKSARAPNPPEDEGKERPWQEEIIIDDRIGSRMRKPEPATIEGEPKGHLLAWKGGADTMEEMSWWRWLKWSFDMDYPEPKCKGWEDGLKDEEV